MYRFPLNAHVIMSNFTFNLELHNSIRRVTGTYNVEKGGYGESRRLMLSEGLYCLDCHFLIQPVESSL